MAKERLDAPECVADLPSIKQKPQLLVNLPLF
jgi:hypothetical protein